MPRRSTHKSPDYDLFVQCSSCGEVSFAHEEVQDDVCPKCRVQWYMGEFFTRDCLAPGVTEKDLPAPPQKLVLHNEYGVIKHSPTEMFLDQIRKLLVNHLEVLRSRGVAQIEMRALESHVLSMVGNTFAESHIRAGLELRKRQGKSGLPKKARNPRGIS